MVAHSSSKSSAYVLWTCLSSTPQLATCCCPCCCMMLLNKVEALLQSAQLAACCVQRCMSSTNAATAAVTLLLLHVFVMFESGLKPGYYLRSWQPVVCSKGSWNEGLNRAATCSPCAENVTTAGPGATSAADCKCKGVFCSLRWLVLCPWQTLHIVAVSTSK
jgi:hypothetical protein